MAETLRVAMLGAYPLDSTRINGGVQGHFLNLVNGLSQMDDLDIHILTLRPRDYTGKDRIEEANRTLHFLPQYPRFERLRNYRTYQKIINQYLGQIQPDLIHVQDTGGDAVVALRTGYPTVITVHGIRWEDGKYYSSWSKRLRVIYDSLLTERYAIHQTHHLIAISPYVTRYFKNMMSPEIEIYHIPIAVDERFFNVSQKPDENIILFAGRVIPRKRVMDLVRAFAMVHKRAPSAQLRIAGEVSTEPEYAESIRRWAHAAHLDNHVQFLGLLPETSIVQEFTGCSLLALPSAQETSPLVISQAMAAGKPVVATRVCGVADMLGEHSERGFLVDVGDIDSLAEAMLRLLQCTDLRARLGQNGRAYAHANYHSENVARRTQEVYRHIVFKNRSVND